MFAICLVCHGELSRARPPARYLTAYYLVIAAGGAIGGAFVTLVAPRIFVTHVEWVATLYLAGALALAVGLAACLWLARPDAPRRALQYSLAGIMAVVVSSAAGVLLFDLPDFLRPDDDGVTWRGRNFFGTLTVEERDPDDEKWHRYVLLNGAIAHGMQFTSDERRAEPTTYYGPTTGVAQAVEYFHNSLPKGTLRMGVVGLGTGTMAVFARPGESVTFYDINPAVLELAERGPWFSYLRDCRDRGARCDVRLGDARLSLERQVREPQPPRFHLLVLDAFSGDAIPTHLLTAEAFETYLAALSGAAGPALADQASESGSSAKAAEGAIAVHISNRYLNLEPVVRAMAERFGLEMLHIENDDDDEHQIYAADWVILSRNAALVRSLEPVAAEAATEPAPVLWTDTRSSLFDVVE
jgi:hypothetical protein